MSASNKRRLAPTSSRETNESDKISEDDIRDIYEAFHAFDADSDGLLDYQEFCVN